MPTLTLKNIPDDLYEQLKRTAALNHRSMNSEILVCIEKAVSCTRRDPQAFLAKAQAIRESILTYTLTDEELSQIKRAGRP